MPPGAPACGIWTSAALYLAARVLSASEAMPYPSPGPDYVVERVTALPQVTIRAITQTRDGYLWIGTHKGSIRETPEPKTVFLPFTEWCGTVIGRYKILEQVDEGGFGVVYVAEQKEPVKRRVVLASKSMRLYEAWGKPYQATEGRSKLHAP